MFFFIAVKGFNVLFTAVKGLMFFFIAVKGCNVLLIAVKGFDVFFYCSERV